LKSENFTIENYSDIRNMINFSQWKNEENLLVQIFSGQGTVGLMKSSTILEEELPNAKIIGTTTAGEISDSEVSTSKIVISISSFTATTLKGDLFTGTLDSFSCGQKVAETLFSPQTKLVIIFTDSSPVFNVEDFLDGITSINRNVIVAGGIGGNNGKSTGVAVSFGSIFTLRGVVAIAFESDILEIRNDYNFNWQPIGKEFTVTKAKDSTLLELDRVKAIDVYKKYFGEESILDTGLAFPLIRKKRGTFIARAMLRINDDESLFYGGNFKVGEKVRFGVGNIGMILEDSKLNSSKLEDQNIEAIFTYSCVARFRLMSKQIEFEIQPFRNLAPTSGFFTYGEFYHMKNRNSLLNQTMTYITLSENIHKNTSHKKQSFEETSFSLKTMKSLINFFNVVVDELNEAQDKIIEKNKIIDDSLQHALFLQESILPKEEKLTSFFKDYFVIWQPRDRVGGDIYFFQKFRDEAVFILVDAIGHGIPGALITMSIKATENALIKRFERVISISPSIVLQLFQENFINLTKGTQQNLIGFDGAVVVVNKRHGRVLFSGANIGLCYVDKDGIFNQISGDRISIENRNRVKKEKNFKEHCIKAHKGRKFYISSDGFKDQIGGKNDFPFGKKRCANEVIKIHNRDFDYQKEKLLEVFNDWKGENSQTDDVTFIGFEI
jgi:serine phosphatase RsbU (regulator of sigma subunit)